MATLVTSHTSAEPLPASNAAAQRALTDSSIAVLCGLAAAAYLFLFVPYLASLDADEGIVLQGAVRILAGQLPYRDFFTFITPGSYYWMAALFRLFGTRILVARATLPLLAALFAAFTYLLSRRFFSREAALFTAGTLTLFAVPLRCYVLHNWDSTALSLLALWSAFRWLERRTLRWAAACGVCAGLTILFEQSKGAGLCLGIATGMILIEDRHPGFRHWRGVATIALLAIVPVAAFALYLAAHGALAAAIDDLFWPLHHYSGSNRLAYGMIVSNNKDWDELFTGSWGARAICALVLSPCLLVAALPLALPPLGVRWLRRARATRTQRQQLTLALSVLLASLAALWATGRPDLHHLAFLSPLFFFLMPLLADEAASEWMAKIRPLLGLCVLTVFVLMGLALLWPLRADRIRVSTARGAVSVRAPNNGLAALAKIPAGTRVLVHPYQPLHLFLSGFQSVGRYDFLQAGMHTPQQFAEQARAVANDPPPYAVLDPGFPSRIPDAWPRTQPASLLHDPVSDYVLAHYHPCTALRSSAWRLVLLARQDQACP